MLLFHTYTYYYLLLCSNVLPPSWLQTAHIYCHAVPVGQESGYGSLGLPRLRPRCWPELQSCLGLSWGRPVSVLPQIVGILFPGAVGLRASGFSWLLAGDCLELLEAADKSWPRGASQHGCLLLQGQYGRGGGDSGKVALPSHAASSRPRPCNHRHLSSPLPGSLGEKQVTGPTPTPGEGGHTRVRTPEGGGPGACMSSRLRTVCFGALAPTRGAQRPPEEALSE